MSMGGCGGEGPLRDCSEVLGRMIFFLDNELDQAGADEIKQHLDDCGPCLSQYDLERTVKALVARSCNECAPDTLRERVVVSIRQFSATFETPASE